MRCRYGRRQTLPLGFCLFVRCRLRRLVFWEKLLISQQTLNHYQMVDEEEEEEEGFYRLPLNNKTGHVVTPESSCRTVYSIYHAALANALRRELFHELVQLCPGLTPQAV